MIIRSMDEQDLEKVLEIEHQVFKYCWTKDHYLYELNENPFSYLYVLEENNEILGYVGFWIMFEQAQITTIAINPKEQEQGLGYQLLEFAMERIKREQCESITLEVRKSNIKAQKLYQKCGFVECGIRENYYDDEDAILMGVGI